MNTDSHGALRRSFLCLAGTVLMAVAFTACDSDITSPDTTGTPSGTETAVEIAKELSLPGATGDSLRNAIDRHMQGDPSQLWKLAAELQKSLTEEQKRILFSRGDALLDSLRRHPRPDSPRPHDGPPDSLRGHHGPPPDSLRPHGGPPDSLRPHHGDSLRPHGGPPDSLRGHHGPPPDSLRPHGGPPDSLRPHRGDTLRPRHDGPDSGRHGGPPPPPPPGRGPAPHRGGDSAAMTLALGLTDAQWTALNALRAEQQAAAEALMAQLAAGTIDRATFIAEMEKLHAAREAALATILTPTQLEILKIYEALVVRLPGHPMPGAPPRRR